MHIIIMRMHMYASCTRRSGDIDWLESSAVVPSMSESNAQLRRQDVMYWRSGCCRSSLRCAAAARRQCYVTSCINAEYIFYTWSVLRKRNGAARFEFMTQTESIIWRWRSQRSFGVRFVMFLVRLPVCHIQDCIFYSHPISKCSLSDGACFVPVEYKQ